MVPGQARENRPCRTLVLQYGRSLLLTWVPATGDPLTIVAGVLREPFGNLEEPFAQRGWSGLGVDKGLGHERGVCGSCARYG